MTLRITSLLMPAVLLFCLAISLSGCRAAKAGPKTPNIVLFLVDDLGWTDLGSYGSDFYQTPNVDALVSEGVKFTNAYSAATVCSPTRASILTGLYPASLNLTDWIPGHSRPYARYEVPEWTMRIDPATHLLPEALKDLGYRTIHIGKWHLGEAETDWPEYHGFDVNVGGWKVGSPRLSRDQGGYFSPYHNPRLPDGPDGEYLTERLAQEAVDFITSNTGGPFFLNFWMYNVHLPLEASVDKITRYEALKDPQALQANPVYAAMVEHMDDAVGRVIEALKAHGLHENTIVIFASDNGGITGDRGDPSVKPRFTSNHPLRTGKGDMYEGGVRVPFAISWPGHIRPGISSVLTISPDIYPTLLGLLKAEEKAPHPFDGINLAPLLLSGEAPPREAIFWHYPHYHTEGARPYSAIRKGPWKLIQIYGQEALELYNLQEDPGERTNRMASDPEIGRQLLEELRAWKVSTRAQVPKPNPHFDPDREAQWKWR